MVLHKTESELVHKVTNPFSSEKRELFFFSDPPHLIKTARNCLASNKRSLWVGTRCIVLFSILAKCGLRIFTITCLPFVYIYNVVQWKGSLLAPHNCSLWGRQETWSWSHPSAEAQVRACSPDIFFQNEGRLGCTGMSTRELMLFGTILLLLFYPLNLGVERVSFKGIDTEGWTWGWRNCSFSLDDGQVFWLCECP